MARAWEPVSAGTFFMMGIIHRHRQNSGLIRDCIEMIRPEVITVELSAYGLAFRRSMRDACARKIEDARITLGSQGYKLNEEALGDLYSYIDVPYEFRAAEEYCSENSAVVYPVDMDYYSYVKLKDIDELISAENIRNTLAAPVTKGASAEEVLARLYFRSGVAAFPYTEEMKQRDGFMCRRIGFLREHFAGRRFLHIAGWRHLTDPLSLYAQFDPVKIFPYD